MIFAKKIKPEFFEAVISGKKTFEVRKADDTEYSAGDFLALNEWSDEDGYTERCCLVEITYVLRDCPAIEKGVVVLGIHAAAISTHENSGYRSDIYSVPYYDRRGQHDAHHYG